MKSLTILIIYAFIFSTSAPLGAETGPPAPWWGEVSTGLIYDNNIFQSSNNKESDLIQESSLFLAYKKDDIKWSGRAIYDRYGSNSELSYSFFEVGGERPFGKHDYGSFFLNLSPSALLDKQDPTRAPFALESYGFSASFDRDTNSIGNIGIALSYTGLNYDSPFDAKDTHIISLSPSLYYRVNDLWAVYSEYAYEYGKARSGVLPGGFSDDISYEAHAFSLKLSHRFSALSRLRFRYRIRNKRFTAGNNDPFHAGRKDTHHAFYAALEHRPLKQFLVVGRLDRLWRTSTDPFVTFSENRLMFSVAYQF